MFSNSLCDDQKLDQRPGAGDGEHGDPLAARVQRRVPPFDPRGRRVASASSPPDAFGERLHKSRPAAESLDPRMKADPFSDLIAPGRGGLRRSVDSSPPGFRAFPEGRCAVLSTRRSAFGDGRRAISSAVFHTPTYGARRGKESSRQSHVFVKSPSRESREGPSGTDARRRPRRARRSRARSIRLTPPAPARKSSPATTTSFSHRATGPAT